jgi:RNA polymerase sigma factor (sigma-70 family)
MAEYAPMVYNTGRRVLGSDEQAADVVQETFFDFLKNAPRITESLGSWLHQVAARRAVDLIRGNSARRRREAAYASDNIPETETWAEVEPLVDEALDELPDEMRELLIAHYLRGESMSRIALAKALSQPTVSRRITAALEALRAGLRGRGVTVGLVALGALLAERVQALPEFLLDSLRKIALVQAARNALARASAAAAEVPAQGPDGVVDDLM